MIIQKPNRPKTFGIPKNFDGNKWQNALLTDYFSRFEFRNKFCLLRILLPFRNIFQDLFHRSFFHEQILLQGRPSDIKNDRG